MDTAPRTTPGHTTTGRTDSTPGADDLTVSRPGRAAALLAGLAAVAAVAALVVPAKAGTTAPELPNVAGVRTAGQLADALDAPEAGFAARRTTTVADVATTGTVTRRGNLLSLDEGGATMVWDTEAGLCTTTGTGGELTAREPVRGKVATLATVALGDAARALRQAPKSLVGHKEGTLRWARRDLSGTFTVVTVRHDGSGRVTGVDSLTVYDDRPAEARSTKVSAPGEVRGAGEPGDWPALGCARQLGH